jgi:ABC-type transport system involved in cytochrome bd biosynthesis fused ATPase/permease subunit
MRIFDQFLSDVSALENLQASRKLERDGLAISDVGSVTLLAGTYGNEGNRITVVKNTTFNKGEKIAVIGESGAGKSTLLGLLFGISPEARELVMWGSNKLSNVSSKSQLELSGYCPQNPNIFPATLAENTFQDLTNKTFQSTLELLSIQNLSSIRGEIDEKTISGGEAKRVSLARLLSLKKPLMIFDEPTSGLNPEIANTVWSAILKGTEGSIVFCSTHDYTTLSTFDHVLLVKDRTVAAIKPDSLIEPQIQ